MQYFTLNMLNIVYLCVIMIRIEIDNRDNDPKRMRRVIGMLLFIAFLGIVIAFIPIIFGFV